MRLEQAQRHFTPNHCFLNTATIGLGPKISVKALEADLAEWASGNVDPVRYDELVDRSRTAFAKIAGVRDARDVAIISQLSPATGVVAAALAPGDEVLVADDDFTSVLFPLLARSKDGVKVKSVPLEAVIDSIEPSTRLVAVSAVQSSNGKLIDLDALAEATADTATLTFVDTTQAAGWLPIGADRFSVTAAAAYKWLCSPRGSGFMTVRPDAMEQLRPNAANWYSAESRWESIYGGPLRMAESARRFDLSPAWSAWVAAAPTLEMLASVGTEIIHEHNLFLANQFRAGLGMEPSNSAIVSFEHEGADVALKDAHISAASRAGSTRLSFHLYNTGDDVEAALTALA